MCIVVGTMLVWLGWGVRTALGEAQRGAAILRLAVVAVKAGQYEAAEEYFRQAAEILGAARSRLWPLTPIFRLTEHIPSLEQAGEGYRLLLTAAHLAEAGEDGMHLVQRFEDYANQPAASWTKLLDAPDTDLQRISANVQSARSELEALSSQHSHFLPPEKLQELRDLLPPLASGLALYVHHADVVRELLGGNGPRTYLFLFQNNHELRATGGFIGSYAELKMRDGQLQRFFIGGIFDPDGQLKENIVPPEPLQKVSAAWSLHDSNWFPDFPTSAEKARFFYEKTGGPTTDGVIAITPVVLTRLLELTGPVELPAYGVTVDAENLIPILQEQVEEKYDREENQPKKILGDLAPMLLERLLRDPSLERWQAMSALFGRLLAERHILLYARDAQIQALFDEAGWSGRVRETPGDYLSVIHSNINGFKTDGVIRETIEHEAKIEGDGSLVDSVSITREHLGGKTPYDWWNRVNADYMRVYVPLGAELLSAEGMTRETVTPPLDYDALAFRRDPDVVSMESALRIDPVSGTRIGVEFGKTVFGNWVYVSPGEKVTVTYRYRLPRLRMSGEAGLQPYSILFQKQAGTVGVSLMSRVEYPDQWQNVWQSRENLIPYGRSLSFSATLDTDVYLGLLFQEKL